MKYQQHFEIDITYGSEFQKNVHSPNFELFLKAISKAMEDVHKQNKLVFKISEVKEVTK